MSPQAPDIHDEDEGPDRAAASRGGGAPPGAEARDRGYRNAAPAGKAPASLRWRYLLLGVFVGIGAPAGLYLVRLAAGPVSVSSELRLYRVFYLFDLLGTSTVLGVIGFLAGRYAERLRRRRNYYHDLAEHDDLTGLFNARAFQRRYRTARLGATRAGQPLSLLLVDVDRLGRVNEEAGHACGNAALLHASEVIRSVLRTGDIASRWGADEFLLLLPGADAGTAARIGESLVNQARGTFFHFGGQQRRVTVSVGGATQGTTARPRDLVGAADLALLAAKREGGNRYLGTD